MRPYAAILSARFRSLLQYRAAAFAGLITQLFWGLIRMMIFMAFYENATSDTPMNLEQVIAYVWLGQAFILLVPFRVDAELAAMVRSGNVAYELLRPVDLYNFWYSRAIATRIAPTMMRSIPIITIATIAGWIHWPGLSSLSAGIACIAGAILLGSSIAVVMSITLFWTISGRGVNMITAWFGFIFSGMVLPLPLFPDWFQSVLNILPFRGLVDLPFRMLTGHIPPERVIYILGHQLAWTVAIILFGRWLLGRAVKHLVVQGG